MNVVEIRKMIGRYREKINRLSAIIMMPDVSHSEKVINRDLIQRYKHEIDCCKGLLNPETSVETSIITVIKSELYS